jgi:uncharacterized membrane protein
MIARFICSFLAAIIGILTLTILCSVQQPDFKTANLFFIALFYYAPGMYILIVFSVFLIYAVRQSKTVSRFLKTDTGFFLTLLAFVLISSIVKDKIINDYEFVTNFAIAYIVSMLFYCQSLIIFPVKNDQ